jgi:6-phosphogluconolactonase (cycloisomerase 2 family)
MDSPGLLALMATALLWCALLLGCAGSTGSTGQSSNNPGSNNPGGNGSSGRGAVVYVSETSGVGTLGGLIEGFALDTTSGVLTPLAGSPFATGSSTTNDMALPPNGGNLYVLGQQFPSGTCCVGPSSLLVFALDPNTGAPSLKQSLATNASEGSKLAVAPSGKFVYVAPYSGEASINGIGIFGVQSDGTLVASGSLASSQSTGDVVMSLNGAFLYTSSDGGPVGNLGNNPCGPFNSFIWGFSVDAETGALAPLPGSPFTFQRQLCEVGHAPNYVTKQIDPRGQRLFVIDSFNADITSFAINPSTGALTLLPGATPGGAVAGFTSSAMDPLRPFLYVGSTIDFFTGFSLTGNAASGVLPLLAGMPAQVAPLPNFNEGSTALAVDSSGNFLFSNENGFTSAFSCCGPDDFVEFRIDSATGALTQLRSAPAQLAGTASRIAPAPPR